MKNSRVKKDAKKAWAVYIVECADGSLYAGSTTDLSRRIEEHNTSPKGAHYTKMRRPVTLKYAEKFSTRSEALKRECEIKKRRRQEKLVLIGAHQKPPSAEGPLLGN